MSKKEETIDMVGNYDAKRTRVNIWVDEVVYDKFKRTCVEDGRTISDVLRQLIAGYIRSIDEANCRYMKK